MNEEVASTDALLSTWSRLSLDERKDRLEEAKKSLPVEYREDGPPLGFEFETVTSDWFLSTYDSMHRSVMGSKGKKMVIGEYDAEAGEDGSIQEIRKRIPAGGSSPLSGASPLASKHFFKRPDGSLYSDEFGVRVGKKGEKVVRSDKDLERQMKKKERKLNKEKERLNRERMKELEKQEKEKEKLLRVQQKEEEKQKLQQERDQKKLEREMEKERKAEERKKQQEDKKREKDLQKALAAQRKVAQKEIERRLDAGPPDDLVLEMDELMKNRESELNPDDIPDRPVFPPPSLELEDAFPELSHQVSSDVFMVWTCLQSFAEIIGVCCFPLHQFIQAISIGQRSLFFSSIHIGLIRLIQADMEVSHHLVLTQGSGGTSNFMDRAVVGISGTLDEALAWGFDVDSWRAHLNPYTWPEILRQLAIAAGYGPKRMGENKERLMKSSDDAEDVIEQDPLVYSGLNMPSRLTQGTVKAAAWHVLAEVGPEGLTIAEIATRIQKQGLRDLRTSKTPEATVAGALSRDSVFARVAPATYALQVIVSSLSDLTQPGTLSETPDLMEGVESHEDVATESWIHALTHDDYAALSFESRLEVLKTLCNMALDSPTIRACLEARLEREIAQQKKMDLEARAEKRARREQAAEETQKRLMEMDQVGQLTPMQVETVSENLDNIVKSVMTESLQHSVNISPGYVNSRLSESLPVKAQNHVRFEPIGMDRRFNRYWRLCQMDCVDQSSENCVYVEIEGIFKVVKTQEVLDELIKSLDRRGAREGPLYNILNSFKLPREVPDEHLMTENMELALIKVPWVELFCQKLMDLDFNREELEWLERLKLDVENVEAVICPKMKRDLDVMKWKECLHQSNCLSDVMCLMGRLEYTISSDILYSSYRKQPLLLSGAWRHPRNCVESANGVNASLSWLPPSFAAAYLHLCRLDASLYYIPGILAGRETLMSYKYVQKPFVRDLNPHVDATNHHEMDKENGLSHVVSVEPISNGGTLVGSSFPVLQKGLPVQKRPEAFSFETEKVKEAVFAAERNGTLYAHMQVNRGRMMHCPSNGMKSNHHISAKSARTEMDDEASQDGMVASSEDQEMRDNGTYDDEEEVDVDEEVDEDEDEEEEEEEEEDEVLSENSTDGYDVSHDGDDYSL